MEMKKRFEVSIDGIQRESGELTIKEIKNRFNQKWFENCIPVTDEIIIKIKNIDVIQKLKISVRKHCVNGNMTENQVENWIENILPKIVKIENR